MYLLAIKQVLQQLIIGIGLWFTIFAIPPAVANTCQPTDSVTPRNLRQFWVFTGLGYGIAQVGLYAAWYREQPQQRFQFFNDGAQWKQVDKLGHFYSAFQLSQVSAQAFRRAGIAPDKSVYYGSTAGFLLLLPTEVFDGFSQAYGFSWYDLAANAAGSALLLGQHMLWQEIRIHPKFSFHRTSLAPQRPGTLGRALAEEVLKDYNGQTYWLSVDLHAFTRKRVPRWLNVALGYGAHAMLHARADANQAAGYTAYREFYLTLDLDLHHYRKPPTTFGRKLWNGLLYTINLVHLPAPAVSYQTGRGFVFYPLYF